uniref:Splicing factor n=1 Tax=Tanacetum cinerariifolium TaxID=118510 RepID=A0A6L2MAQ0_TANCI|nr:splicing factor [Tanacetum cinerariifolium]
MKGICITIHHEDIFSYDPLSYDCGDVEVVENVDLGNTSYERLMKIVKECCLFPVHGMYFCASKVDIGKHLKPLRNDYELANFVKLSYDNGCKVELYVEHHGYNVLDGVTEEVVDEELDDEIELEDVSEFVGLDHVGEEDVELLNTGLNDIFLNMLVDGKFISDKDFEAKVDTQSSSSRNVDDSSVDGRFKKGAREVEKIPKVLAVSAYCMLNQDPGKRMSSWYSKQMWVDVYSNFIKPVGGSSIWVNSANPPPLPPKKRIMPGRPRKNRIKHVTEGVNQLSKDGRYMTCSYFWEKGHNKARCYNQTRPKPQQEKRKPGRKSQQATNQPFNLPNADPSLADPSAANPSLADPSAADPSSVDPNKTFTGLLNCVEQQSMGAKITDAEIAALADMNEVEEREARERMLKGFLRRKKRSEFIEREVLVDGEDHLRG